MPTLWMVKLTLLRSLRMKLNLVILALLLVLLFVLPLTVLDDGTVKGKIQIQIIWVLGGVLFLLSTFTLLNIIMNIRLDISERQIYVLESTPIERWQMLAGKIIGIFLMNILLIVVTGLVSYGFIYDSYYQAYKANQEAEKVLERNANDENSLITKRDYHVLINDVLAARLKAKASYDVEELTKRSIYELKLKGTLPKPEEELRREFRSLYQQHFYFSASAGEKANRPIIFEDIRKPDDKTLFYTFSYYLSSTDSINGRIIGIWDVFIEDDTGQQQFVSSHPIDHANNVRSSLRFSTQKLDTAKTIYFIFTNHTNTTILNSGREDFYLLYPYSSFELNYTKALLLVLMKVTLISFVGAFLATFLTYNVATLIGFVFLFFCYLTDTLLQTILATQRVSGEVANVTSYFNDTWNRVANSIIKIFPDFNHVSGKALIAGELIPASLLLNEIIFNIVLRGSFFLLFAFVIFHFVEIGLGNQND